MGVVYLATDLLANSRVALKINGWSGAENMQKAFETEAKLLARLDHAGLPKVRDYFILDDNSQALVMDFVEGETLTELLESEKYRNGCAIDARIVVDWSFQILDILSYLHHFSPPVIHRDIKPNNIKLKADGTIVLLDFGLAKGTAASVVSGGSSYSSLEQLNLTTTDARSDIYALGATVYHLLTNYYPLNALDRFQQFYCQSLGVSGNQADQTALQTDPQKAVSEINPNVPPQISEIVMKALSLFPQDRFQTAEEMKAALLSAVQNFDDSSFLFKVKNQLLNTKKDIYLTSARLKGLLEDEEILNPRTLKEDENLNSEKNFDFSFSPLKPPVVEVENNGFADQQATFLPNDDFTTFEIQPPSGKKTKRGFGRKTTPLIIGVLTLIFLALIGFATWIFIFSKQNFSPNDKTEKTTASETETNDSSPLKSDKTRQNPLQISTYLIKDDGAEIPLADDYLFADNDQFRFGVKSETEGFLYVISRNNRDLVQLAYPLPHQVDNSMKKDSENYFPPENGKFRFNKTSPSEMWAYFVVVASRENDLAKRIRTTLGDNKEKALSLEKVRKLMNNLDEIALNSKEKKENNANSTEETEVGIVKLQKNN